jgi:hypothetical protein
MPCSATARFDHSDRLNRAAAQIKAPADDLAVQQSIIAFR